MRNLFLSNKQILQDHKGKQQVKARRDKIGAFSVLMVHRLALVLCT